MNLSLDQYRYHREQLALIEPAIRKMVRDARVRMPRRVWLAWCVREIGISRCTAYRWTKEIRLI